MFQCIIVHYSVLQCAAVCCTACCLFLICKRACMLLQSDAVCCSVLQRVAVCCSVLHSSLFLPRSQIGMSVVAVCWNVLQCVAVCCNVSVCCGVLQLLQYAAQFVVFPTFANRIVRCCSALLCVAVSFNVLQRVAVCRLFLKSRECQ